MQEMKKKLEEDEVKRAGQSIGKGLAGFMRQKTL